MEVADPIITRKPDTDFIATLQSELHLIRNRVKELEAENLKLSSRLSNCCCQKMEEDNGLDVVDRIVEGKEDTKLDYDSKTNKKKSKDRLSGWDAKAIYCYSKRYVALKIMYFGQRFYGFASEAQMDPTVESEIFKALEKTRLIFGDKKALQYSRCGRTDKGVSSAGQVIALFLRSNQKEIEVSSGSFRETVPSELCEEEIDYVRILNRVLAKDIRVMGWAPVPNDFSARFSCLSREYYYFFWKENLNIEAMETAGRKFIGENDFRNFCKMDAANVHNYRRKITLFVISPCHERFDGIPLWVMKIKGSAFLWHQIRCMVAVLFLVGQGLESPDVIDALLDIEKTPRKPQYTMAPEMPLVLQSCEFEGLKFMCSLEAKQALHAHLEKECRNCILQSAIFHEALLSCLHIETDDRLLNNKTRKKEPVYVPLMSRLTEPSYDERRAKLDLGTGRD